MAQLRTTNTHSHGAVSGMDDDSSLSLHSNSESFMSTNYTMSNLPGTGRLLDKLYRAGGRKIERLLGRLAQRAGYGPDAVSSRIRKLAWTFSNLPSEVSGPFAAQSEKEKRELSELCRRLLNYSQSSLESTQMRAITNITDLLKWEPMLCGVFKQHNAALFLYFAGKDVLRISSHPGSYPTSPPTQETRTSPLQALEWTRNDTLVELGSIILSAREHKSPNLGRHDESPDEILQASQWSHAFRSLQNHLKSQGSAFLALQYFYWWSYGVERNVVDFDFCIALELAETLTVVLSYDDLFQATDPHYLEITARRVLSNLNFDFALFLKHNSECYAFDDLVEIDGVLYHIPSVNRIMEDLGQRLHTRRLVKHTNVSARQIERKILNAP